MSQRTVFVSSRMDETSASRQAAFAAIRDAKARPLAYEFLPSVEQEPTRHDTENPTMPTRMVHVPWGEQARKRIDHLLSLSDMFIGIYADTFGDRQGYLCGLRPVEYEFIRFLIQHRIRESPGQSKLSLEDYLPIGDLSFHHPSLEPLRQEVLAIRRDLSRLAGIAGPHYDGAVIPDSALAGFPYARLCNERVRLFLRRRLGDGSISTSLVRALRGMPLVEFASRFSGDDRKHGHLTLIPHVPAASLLHQYVHEFVHNSKSSTSERVEHEYSLLVKFVDRESPEPLDLLVVLEGIYRLGLNISRLEFGTYHVDGRPSAGAVMCAFRDSLPVAVPAGGARSFSSGVRSFLQKFLSERRGEVMVACSSGAGHYKALLKPASAEYVAPIDTRAKRGAYILATPLREKSAVVLTLKCDDHPGMLYKVIERVDYHDGEVLHIRLREEGWTATDRIGFADGAELIISTSDPVIHILCRWKTSELAGQNLRKLRSNLNFIAGVHGVLQGTASFDTARGGAPVSKVGRRRVRTEERGDEAQNL